MNKSIVKREIKLAKIFFRDETLFTDSLIVASVFGKEHKDVLKAIRNLDCSSELHERSFTPVEYKDAKGEMRPMYEIKRDGLMYLIMGFTGEAAAFWKERFINQFNYYEDCQKMIPQCELEITKLQKSPLTSLGFNQMSLEERIQQRRVFHQIFNTMGLTQKRNTYRRIQMCRAVNLIVNGMTSYRIRQMTGMTGQTRDWLPQPNQEVLFRTELALLAYCKQRNWQLPFAELEMAYTDLAAMNKHIVELISGVNLHDEIEVHVRQILDETQQQLQDDKITPYQLTEGQVYQLMEQKAQAFDTMYSITP